MSMGKVFKSIETLDSGYSIYSIYPNPLLEVSTTNLNSS